MVKDYMYSIFYKLYEDFTQFQWEVLQESTSHWLIQYYIMEPRHGFLKFPMKGPSSPWIINVAGACWLIYSWRKLFPYADHAHPDIKAGDPELMNVSHRIEHV